MGPMGERIIEEPWTMVVSDIIGPLPLSKNRNKCISVFTDLFRKWVEIIPIKKADGKMIENAFHKKLVSRWGTPRILISDNGTEYANKVMREMSNKLGIRHSFTPKYYPQPNPTERTNRSIKKVIKAYLGKEHNVWDQNIDDL